MQRPQQEIEAASRALPEGHEFYPALAQELVHWLDRHWATNLSNASALLMQHVPRLNWAGFYLNVNGELALGPFQGKPACLRIAFGRGVCGAAAASRQSQRVPDVHAFPGHIACDSASRSELVIPLLARAPEGERLLGVLDLDSPHLDRFGAEDQAGLEAFARELVARTEWPASF